jgi:hypothetical protein
MSALRSVLLIEAVAVLGVYFFITAPPPLESAAGEQRIPIRAAFELLNQENARVRALYAQDIVGAGQKSGLVFDEQWEERGHHSGPLPALFLRSVAEILEERNSPLRLFLTSDEPINRSNMVQGGHLDQFREMREKRAPIFSVARDVQLQTAMFPDVAAAPACVDCHNRHPSSPKRDWRLGDVMGSVTWTHPRESVSPAELAQMIGELRGAIGLAYDRYLKKISASPRPPRIGRRWPREGYYLPNREKFLAAAEQRTSAMTLSRLLSILQDPR